ncbi:hypothetical protein A2870_03370 [Candidatus Curtissbacteria bacterium RIFCSPHIGHO2_01_FULL_41_11]|uniref:Ketosynthase family 3 (KS3) domain-containing protein n=1 Tax=Candidatus Curtissbacteria bacterium RIFCSPHIGHO2_01_FULL_41_11 TaxID=1797711 RepID=A0A1F5G5L5_9BACT|nr:MAG: hypothetical protein A2870_03370 [Candidatus Curtissbacteria bacterium RIFCSPHIGHO2_01_FULL_41_11]
MERSSYSPQGEWANSPERQSRRIVVTGISLITPLGIDTKTTWENIIASRSGFRSFDLNELARNSNYPEQDTPDTKIEASVAGIIDIDVKKELGEYGIKKNLHKMSRSTQLSLLASTQALTEAGLLENGEIRCIPNPARFGVRIGTLLGGTHHLINVHSRIQRGLRPMPSDVLIAGPERISSVPSMAFGAMGPVETPVAACATGSLAIIGGAQDIFEGDADIMLVGGVDAPIHPDELSMYDILPALSREKDPNLASRPFDKSRDGFVMAEGAGVLVLESEEHAKKRGAKILAVFSGYGKASDADHDTRPNGRGAKIALDIAIRRAGLPDSGILYYNAHGTGTIKGDDIEVEAFLEVFGSLPQKPDFAISSTKSSMGHTRGASGAIEAGIAILALNSNTLPPTLHLENPIDEASCVNLVPNDAQAKKVGIVYSGNFGFGGMGAVVAFEKP